MKATKLNESLSHCLKVVDTLPGMDMTQEDQRVLYEQLSVTLERKRCVQKYCRGIVTVLKCVFLAHRAQVEKYRQLPVFAALGVKHEPMQT